MSRLEVRGLHKTFPARDGAGPVEVLRGLDLDVPSGAIVAVLGPSGCGKTTLLRVVAGFEEPDDGVVSVGGRTVAARGTGLAPERRRVAVVPQEGALFPHLSVARNVAFGLPSTGRGWRRGGWRQRRTASPRRVRELLDLVGLADLAERMPAELSGGQQQRVALARALAPEPEVVLLDEPFSALDAGMRASVRADVTAALRATGATAVLVTHDQEEALSTADLVAVMRDGVVVQSGSPQAVYRAPGDVEVATFVGEAVVLDARVTDGVAHTLLGRLPVLRCPPGTSGPGRVVIRPEQVRITGAGRGGLPATVLSTTFYGHDASVRLRVGDGPGTAGVEVLCRTQGPVPTTVQVGVLVAGPVSFFPS